MLPFFACIACGFLFDFLPFEVIIVAAAVVWWLAVWLVGASILFVDWLAVGFSLFVCFCFCVVVFNVCVFIMWGGGGGGGGVLLRLEYNAVRSASRASSRLSWAHFLCVVSLATASQPRSAAAPRT